MAATKDKPKAPVVCTCSTGDPATCRRHRYLYSPWQGAYERPDGLREGNDARERDDAD